MNTQKHLKNIIKKAQMYITVFEPSVTPHYVHEFTLTISGCISYERYWGHGEFNDKVIPHKYFDTDIDDLMEVLVRDKKEMDVVRTLNKKRVEIQRKWHDRKIQLEKIKECESEEYQLYLSLKNKYE